LIYVLIFLRANIDAAKEDMSKKLLTKAASSSKLNMFKTYINTNQELVGRHIMNDQDARNRIIKAAIEILDEVTDVDKITVRQVAERANVGTGLINYHFKTKNNLLSLAVGDVMAQMATKFSRMVVYVMVCSYTWAVFQVLDVC
jgi:AcrR family transcriptional regulator